MDFLEDLFERKNHHGRRDHHDHDAHNMYPRHDDDHHHREQRYRNDHHDKDSHFDIERFRPILMKILQNKPLAIGLAVGGVVIFVIGLGLLVLLLPTIGQLFEAFSKHGLKGIIEGGEPIFERLWKGSE